jgi:hypothetical protein
VTWPIRLLDKRPTWDERQVGDAWWAAPDDDAYSTLVGTKHRHLERVLWVSLPGIENGYPFCVHAPATREGPDGAGWSVSGDAPRITVEPSINIVGSYHGWIRDGVISDDCEGRRFNADGSPA